MGRGKEISKEQLDKWFLNFTNQLKSSLGIDVESSLALGNLKTFSFNENGEMTNFESVFKREEENSAYELINGKKTILNISEEEKRNLYDLVSENKLCILKGVDIFDAKGVYLRGEVENGITNGVAELLDEVDFEKANEGRDEEEKISEDEFYKRQVFAADDAKKVVLDYRKLYFGILNSFTTNSTKETTEISINISWESRVIEDYHAHPEFYENEEIANERGKLLLSTCKAEYAGAYPEWMDDALLNEKHPIDYYDDLVNIIKNKGFEPNELISGGLITDQEGHMYEVGNYPWDAIDKINSDILNGKKVRLDIPNKETGELETYELFQKGENIKISDKPIVKSDINEVEAIRNLIVKANAAFDSIGSSFGDSNEYKMLKGTLERFSSGISDDITKDDLKTIASTIEKESLDYFYAKADQSQNKRRSERFEVCSILSSYFGNYRNGSGFKCDSEIDRQKKKIASKILKTQSVALLKSNDAAIKNAAESILSNSRVFDSEVNRLLDTNKFKEMFNNKNLEELKNNFNLSGKALLNNFNNHIENARENVKDPIKDPVLNI